MIERGLFSASRTPSEMIINDIPRLSEIVSHIKGIGLRVGLTQGTYDLLHVGHSRYLAAAKTMCDILIVGVDSDEKVRKAKGPNRPIVNQAERMEQLCYQSAVNIVCLKEEHHSPLFLLKSVMPDVLIISKSTKQFPEERIREYREHCGELVILEPQAETSTTARVRMVMLDFQKEVTMQLSARIPQLVEEVAHAFLHKGRQT
jgi:D-beta-D-heptose 7-phosphate kinase/D-beta-D-heptose 1-phosphate adenosyltransferase